MIRQAISCDICGAEKKQTNHWFVAWEQTGELRVSGWNSRNRLRTGAKHLCGQVCLHKLADDFMARVIAQKVGGKAPADEIDVEPDAMAAAAPSVVSGPRAGAAASPVAARVAAAAGPYSARGPNSDASLTSTGLTSPAGSVEVESSARLLPAAADASRPELRTAAALVTMRERLHVENLPVPTLPAIADETARFATHNRRTEAWQRERERTQRAGESRPETVTRLMAGNGN